MSAKGQGVENPTGTLTARKRRAANEVRANEYERVGALTEPLWKRNTADINAGQYVNSRSYHKDQEKKPSGGKGGQRGGAIGDVFTKIFKGTK